MIRYSYARRLLSALEYLGTQGSVLPNCIRAHGAGRVPARSAAICVFIIQQIRLSMKGVYELPGAILGVYGQQRSGKTLLAYKMAKGLQNMAKKQGIDLPVYTNLYSPNDKEFKFVNSMDELPLDLSPKIVLIDEIYNGCDAQDYRKLKDISIFINTIGKQNCLFIFTSIDAQMVYNRIRNQMSVVVLVKASTTHIHYKFVALNTGKMFDYVVEKNAGLFKDVLYDTNFIPLDFDWSMRTWRNKLEEFYEKNYDIKL